MSNRKHLKKLLTRQNQ